MQTCCKSKETNLEINNSIKNILFKLKTVRNRIDVDE